MCIQCQNLQLVELYNRQAEKYARLRQKKKSYDHAWRQSLLQRAKGNVLELSVGAGANFRFYPKEAMITAADISPNMVEKAREAAQQEGIQATMICSPVEELQVPDQSFDTVVSSLSLCAYDDPVHVLGLFRKWCKPEGHILLMEHGLASPKALQWLQHRLDSYQYRKIGCHANRDILQLIRLAGIKIIKLERKFFGMIYLIEAKP